MIKTAGHCPDWTSDDWYRAAVEAFGENHQGCPCCQEQHCVFRSQWGSRTEYHCHACDFSAAHDLETDICTATPGDAFSGALFLCSLDADGD